MKFTSYVYIMKYKVHKFKLSQMNMFTYLGLKGLNRS